MLIYKNKEKIKNLENKKKVLENKINELEKINLELYEKLEKFQIKKNNNKKIEKENKNLKEQIKIPTFKKEMKLQELYKEQLAIEKNLQLYSNLLNEKKKWT